MKGQSFLMKNCKIFTIAEKFRNEQGGDQAYFQGCATWLWLKLFSFQVMIFLPERAWPISLLKFNEELGLAKAINLPFRQDKATQEPIESYDEELKEMIKQNLEDEPKNQIWWY